MLHIKRCDSEGGTERETASERQTDLEYIHIKIRQFGKVWVLWQHSRAGQPMLRAFSLHLAPCVHTQRLNTCLG